MVTERRGKEIVYRLALRALNGIVERTPPWNRSRTVLPRALASVPTGCEGRGIISSVPDAGGFRLEADPAARDWLESHPTSGPRVIAYHAHRCCGGGKICQVRVRERERADNPDAYVTGHLQDGTTFLIDRRAARRLPSQFGLTVRGLGRFKHLDLALEPDQWGDLLYT